MKVEIRQEPITLATAAEYERIPCRFTADMRMRLEGDFAPTPVAQFTKDYDAEPDERPTAYVRRFDTTKWAALVAHKHLDRVGGAIVARDTPGFDMLGGRADLAVVVDLRVHPDHRDEGIGSMLFQSAKDWARRHGCTELIVETQDTNVAACRLYSKMGGALISVDREGYGPDVDEAKLIWRVDLKWR